jgi:ADP-heptose:LPS heptosyltransferase
MRQIDTIRQLLLAGNIAAALALAEALYSENNNVDDEFTGWLLNEALNWSGSASLLAQQRHLYETVLVHRPYHYEAWHFLGFNAQLEGQYDKAEEYYKKALSLKPDYHFARLAYSQIRMMASSFKQGRDSYESRFDAKTEASGPDWRGLSIKRWQGESVAAKHVYIWAEQGLGDIAMFAGFLHHLMEQAPKRLVLAVFPKLVTLFQRSFPNIFVESIEDAANHALAPTMQTAFPQIEKLAEQVAVPFSLEPLRAAYQYSRKHGLFDIAAPMGDMLVYCLPQYIPSQHQSFYLVAEPDRVDTLRKKLKKLGNGKYIGISWHTQNTRETTRNIPLKEWIPLLTMSGCHFISLQHGVSQQEIEEFCISHHCKITCFPEFDLTQSAEDLSALISAMDEVITIDNSNAHLAGALGKKTTLLLPKGCNYRWPEYEGDKTLWYRHVTVIRQNTLFEWRTVIEKAALKLAN